MEANSDNESILSIDSTDTDSDDSLSDPKDPRHPDHVLWWIQESRAFAEHLYKHKAVSVVKSNPPTLLQLAADAFRKKVFIDAWVTASLWCVDPNPSAPWNQDLYDAAEAVLKMDVFQILKRAEELTVKP